MAQTSNDWKKKVEFYSEKFENAFPDIVNELVGDDEAKPELREAAARLRKSIEYNTFGGKRFHGLTVILTVDFLRNGQLSEDEIKKGIYLGWCFEILKALFLIADDIMDGSELRRGRPCWHKKVGLVSINETYLMEQCIYALIEKHFKEESYLFELYKTFHRVSYLLVMGQELDMVTSEKIDGELNMDSFTEEKFQTIAKYKTGYSFFYLPVCLGFHVAKVTDPKIFTEAETILLELGEYFQVQNDYFDCYGDPSVTGKIGRDIEDAKCSWFITQALKKSNEEQKEILKANYGNDDVTSVAVVKEIYEILEMEKSYFTYKEKSHNSLQNLVQSLGSHFPKELFQFFVMKVFGRNT
eukprot:TCONS_00022802-protein